MSINYKTKLIHCMIKLKYMHQLGRILQMQERRKMERIQKRRENGEGKKESYLWQEGKNEGRGKVDQFSFKSNFKYSLIFET